MLLIMGHAVSCMSSGRLTSLSRLRLEHLPQHGLPPLFLLLLSLLLLLLRLRRHLAPRVSLHPPTIPLLIRTLAHSCRLTTWYTIWRGWLCGGEPQQRGSLTPVSQAYAHAH